MGNVRSGIRMTFAVGIDQENFECSALEKQMSPYCISHLGCDTLCTGCDDVCGDIIEEQQCVGALSMRNLRGCLSCAYVLSTASGQRLRPKSS